MFISVITCTHNPDADNLSRVFKALDQQSLPKDRWDYVVVDNGSDRPLRDSLKLGWHPQGRVVSEPDKGLTRARLRGIAETRADVVVFVDDDNILAPDYLETVCSLLEKHPYVGVLGGVIRGEFQGVVESWMKDFLFIFGVTQALDDPRYEIQYALGPHLGSWMPIGAGMAVRRSMADKYRELTMADPFRLSLDRTGGRSLAGGGDTDLVFTSMDLGIACGVSPLLKCTHVIPSWRLAPAYLGRLLYSSNYGLARLLISHGWKKPTPPDAVSAWTHFRWSWACLTARSPADLCWRAQHRGYLDGLAGKPYDQRYL